MNRSATAHKSAWGLLMLAGAMGAACSGGENVPSWAAAPDPAVRAPHLQQPASAEARALVERLLQAERPILGPALATSITPEGAFLRPHLPALPRSALARRAEVSLPIRANGAFRLADTHSSMAVEVGLAGASDSPAEVTTGFVVYRRGYGAAADVIHRPTAEGTEDYVHFQQPPAEEALGYKVILNEHVAGLRLVSHTLEFLDAAGTPRLRMAPPWGVDARGERFAARVSVSGCAYDADPRAPWNRPTVAPGANRCTVRVEWSGTRVRYPVVIDPAWTTTGSLITARSNHTASVLLDGRVLIEGGGGPAVLASVELYDPATGTFSATGSLGAGRQYHSAITLNSGQVLVTGGAGGGIYLDIAELYHPMTGAWSSAGTMPAGRQLHTSSLLLPEGKVLLAGGSNMAGVLNTADIYDPQTNMWTPTGAMATPRMRHTASMLADGKILVAAGAIDLTAQPTVTAELYDQQTGMWTAAGNLAQALQSHTATVLANGKVLIAGGFVDSAQATATATAEVYDAAMGTFAPAASMITPRALHPASILLSGKVLVAGGRFTVPFANAELYDPDMDTWSDAGNLLEARVRSTASRLPGGTVLVAAGNNGPTYLASAELFLLFQGDPCIRAQDCASGSCADGICCDTTCNGQCESCDGSIAGSTRGTCARATGAAPANRPPCQGDSIACGYCDGISPECVYRDFATQCASACTSGSQSVSYCDGKGYCKPFPTPIPCGPYACDGTTACKTDCAAPADCAPGFRCATGNTCVPLSATCTDDHTLQNETGTPTDCTPFICKGNSCLKTCTSIDDCAAPNVCDATTKQCIAPGTGGAEEAGGCTLAAPASTAAPSWRWLAAIAIAVWLTRRRAVPAAAA